MPEFSEEQKSIALALLHGSKTLEELSKQLNIQSDSIMEQIKPMIKYDLIKKEGYPTRYYLNDKISTTVLRRKKLEENDSNALRLRIIIEAQAIEPELLKKQFKGIQEQLKQEKNFFIYDMTEAEIQKQEEHYTSFIEANLSVKDFKSLVRLLFFYGPSLVEVIKPAKIEFKAADLQEGLVDLSEIVHGYAEYITKLMNRQEIEEFNRKLYGEKA